MLCVLPPTPDTCSSQAPLSHSTAMQPRSLTLQVQPGSTSSHSAPLGQNKPLKHVVGHAGTGAGPFKCHRGGQGGSRVADWLQGCKHQVCTVRLEHARRYQRLGDRTSQAHAQAADDVTLLSCKQLCANTTSSACTEALCLPACTQTAAAACSSSASACHSKPSASACASVSYSSVQNNHLYAADSPVPAPAIEQPAEEAHLHRGWLCLSPVHISFPLIMQPVCQAIEQQPALACQRQSPARRHCSASASICIPEGLLQLRSAVQCQFAVTLTRAWSSASRAESPQPDSTSPVPSRSRSHRWKASRRAAHDPQAGLQLLQALAGSGVCTASDKENAGTASPPLPVRQRPAAAGLGPPSAQLPAAAGQVVAAGVVSPAALRHRLAALPQPQQGHPELGLKGRGARMDGAGGMPEAGQQPADRMQGSRWEQQQPQGDVSGWQQPQQPASAAQQAGAQVRQPLLEAGVRLLPGRHQFRMQVPGQVAGPPLQAQARQPQRQAAQPGSQARAAPGVAPQVAVHREPDMLGTPAPGGRCTAQTAWASVVARSNQWRSADAAREGASRGGFRNAMPADCAGPRSATLPGWTSVRRGGRPRQAVQHAVGAPQAWEMPPNQATAAERQQSQLQGRVQAPADAPPAGLGSLPAQASAAAGQHPQQGPARAPASAAPVGAASHRSALCGAAQPSEAPAELQQPRGPQLPQQSGHLPLRPGSSLSSLVELHRRQQVRTLSAGQVPGSHPAAGQPALSSLSEVHRGCGAMTGRPLQALLLQPWPRRPQAAAAADETARCQAAHPQDRPPQVGLLLSLCAARSGAALQRCCSRCALHCLTLAAPA